MLNDWYRSIKVDVTRSIKFGKKEIILNEKLRKIINHYGIDSQLKHFNSEVFELTEAVVKNRNTGAIEKIVTQTLKLLESIADIKTVDYSREHIKEEIADVMVMLKQIQLYYDVPTKDIKEIMKNKVARQLERIEYEPKHVSEK